MAASERKHLLAEDGFSSKKDYPVHDDDDDDDDDQPAEEVPVCCSYRLWVIICCTLTMTITYSAQASLSAAMVCMIEDKTYHQSQIKNSTTYGYNMSAANITGHQESDWLFTWDKSKQGLAISAFFMGYYVSQIPSSVAAARFGPKRVVVVGLVLLSIFQLLTVPAAYFGIGWLYADRILVGVLDGFLYAPTFALAGQWAPRHETSLLFGIVGMGMELGNVLSYATSLLACEIVVQEGWPFVFYILAGLGLIVAIIFMIVVSDSPFRNRHMSKKEVTFIASCIPKSQPTPDEALSRVPVKEILGSMSVWAIVVSQIGSDWLYYFFVTMEPTFLKDVIKLTYAEVNLLSGLPFLGIIPTIYLAGYLCDKLVTKGVISNTKIRKINDFICKIFPSAILIGLGFLPQESVAAAFVLNLVGAMFMGFSYVSWMANPVDLAPAYTGFIVGLCEIGAIWVGIAVPLVIDDITLDKTREEWQLVFYITAGIQVFCFLFYAFFASGELQPWAVITSRPAYEDLDDQVDRQISRLDDAGMSRSHSTAAVKKTRSVDGENHNLVTSMELSLGDFRGTSSYEASVRRNQEKKKLEGGIASNTLVISGPGHTKSSLLAGQYIPYQGTSIEAIISQGMIAPRYETSNSISTVPKTMASELGFGVSGFETEHYIESDDEWQSIATRSLPSNFTRSVLHGRGDHNISSTLSSPLTSGQFDDTSGPPRNIKSLATEIAEALSIHSQDDPLGSDVNSNSTTPRPQGKDVSAQDHTENQKNSREKGKGLIKWPDFTKKGTGKNIILDSNNSRNIKFLKHRNLSSNRKATVDGTQKAQTREQQLNSGNTSSIMVPADDLLDSTDIGLQNGDNGSDRRRHNTEGETETSGHKDSRQIASMVKRFFLFGRSKSNPHLNLPNEDTFVFVTDDDIKDSPSVDFWATKSFDGARKTKQSSNVIQHRKREGNNKIEEPGNKEDDEHTLFVHPSGKFESDIK